ncbi:MAG: tRNA (N6-threonylcarbamoyladenosine(37)-N6)-methyltransferase TrmO [Anaerolineales bacterium]|nr:tRNA (N6-threonylcarbamoyladenosine(37)-N6)-methyltransferase TrmO [Anaerolineales bacterium]
MELTPIGVVHRLSKDRGEAPRREGFADTAQTLELFPEFTPGRKTIEKTARPIVLYWEDRANRDPLQSNTPFSSDPIGVCASRSPNCPNPIAFCVADLVHREGNRLIVQGMDALDGSPLPDSKIYSPFLDSFPDSTPVPPHSDNLSAAKERSPYG